MHHLDVVYIYYHPKAKWQELRYSIRSLYKHLKVPFRVWLVGDRPAWAANVRHIPIEREASMHAPVCLDACRKMQAIIDHPEIGNEFLYMYDDMFLNADTDTDQLRTRLAMRLMSDQKRMDNTTHRKLMWNTHDMLKASGIDTVHNYETHTPRLFEKDKMQAIFKEYAPTENRLLFSTLYFNHYPETPKLLAKPNPYAIQYHQHVHNNLERYQQELAGHWYINFNDYGLTEYLQQAMELLYPYPTPSEI